MEARLRSLYSKYDEIISDNLQDKARADDLLMIQADLEKDQRLLLGEIARIPSKNQFDIIAKLEIWKSMIIPDGSDPALAQPSDQIVFSVLSDLLAGRANS